jgi:NADPH2:quinone reductase
MTAIDCRALVCRHLADDFGGLGVETLRLPAPGPGQVLVRVRAAAVNFPDLLMSQGRYQHQPELPFVPGLEACGDVAAVGAGVEGVREGDAVMVHSRTGAFAQYTLVTPAELRPKPRVYDYAQAAAFQAASLTAHVALVRRGRLQPGETLLVHGASGGVGMAAVQLGRHLGARVIATGTSDDKLAFVRQQGAHEVVNLREGLRDRVKTLTGGAGADVVFDPVGGEVFDESMRCMAWGGRLLVIGFTSGRFASAPANLVLIKGISVVGVRAGEDGRRNPQHRVENLREIDRLAEAGVFRPHICARLPLDSAVDGFRMLAERRVLGKVVVEP